MLCDNETNAERLWGAANRSPHPKDAVDAAVVHGEESLLAPADASVTKAALQYRFGAVPSGDSVTVRLRLVGGPRPDRPFSTFDTTVAQRHRECEQFYAAVIPDDVSEPDRAVARRAFAGLLWSRQLYRYDVQQWLQGDPAAPVPPPQRLAHEPGGRNTAWRHLALADVISMPDEWEYPWFATWDTAFTLDGSWDLAFLKKIIAKLLMNFSWWVNRKDPDGSDLFEGGFLGLDNIGPIDRSRDVPQGWRLEQSDATSWMAFMCLSMMRIAQEIGRHDHSYDDLATTFLERFMSIAEAMESFGSHGVSLWDETDGFFYDVLVRPDGGVDPLRIRSLVGVLPLIAVTNTPTWVARDLPDFTHSLRWLQQRRPELTGSLVAANRNGVEVLTLSALDRDRMSRILTRLLDESEFLSPYGIRSLSAAHRDAVSIDVAGRTHAVRYLSGESDTSMFGGNSNWRGPVWWPVNMLVVDALRIHGSGANAGIRVEFPTGSGDYLSLVEVADRLEDRLVSMFRPGPDGCRPGDPYTYGSGEPSDRVDRAGGASDLPRTRVRRTTMNQEHQERRWT